MINESYSEKMLKWFEYGHLPTNLQTVSAPFGELAKNICSTIPPSAERTVALRKLLESKDAAVRAYLDSLVISERSL